MTGGPTTIEITTWDELGDEFVLALPAKFSLCPRCRGVGSHVNPSIDGHGITSEEWNGPDWSEDEKETYMSGGYDVACHRCAGEKVIKIVDRDRASAEDLKIYDDQERELRDLEAEEAAERRAGA